MHNDKLCAVFERLGFTQVQPVLASGNLVFTATARSGAALEKKIEQALATQLGLRLDVIVRSQAEIEALLRSDPFQGKEHGRQYYLVVTFRKDDPAPVFNALDRATMDGPKFMSELERGLGKRVTTRTWNTLQKIAVKMRASAG